MKKLILSILLAAFSFTCASAQENVSQTALQFGSVPRDPVALGMGGTTVLGGSMAWSSLSNIAALPFYEKTFAVVGGYQMWQPSSVVGTGNLGVGLAYCLLNGKFGIAASFASDKGSEYETFSSTGISTGKARTEDMMASLGVSYRFIDILSFGVNVKYLSSSLAADATLSGVSVDAMFEGSFEAFKVAAGIASLGGRIKSGQGSYSLPSSIVLAAGYGSVFAEKHGIDATAQMNYYLAGGLNLALGAAYTFNDLVSARVGYDLSSNGLFPCYASVGLGLHFKGITLDASYLFGSETLGGTMAFGLGYHF